MLAQQLVNGLMLGSVYALIGVGYTLVFGVLRMLNLAHSYIFMSGPFIALWLMTDYGVPAPLALVGAVIAAAILGIGLYYVSFRPVPPTHALGGFVSSLSFGVIIQVLAINRFGSLSKQFNVGLTLPDLSIGGVLISGVQLLSLVLSLILMGLLLGAVQYSAFGRNVRAIAENENAAALSGVPVQRSVLFVFGISSVLAGLAGLLVAVRFANFSPFLSDIFALKALAVIVIGGLGDLRGAVVAGILLGLIEVLFIAFTPPGWSEAFVWVALIAVFLFKPDGLFGQRIKRREI